MIDIANEHSVYIKQHNADYLSTQTLSQLNQIGIHALNIAPEFGHLETAFILGKLKQYDLIPIATPMTIPSNAMIITVGRTLCSAVLESRNDYIQ